MIRVAFEDKVSKSRNINLCQQPTGNMKPFYKIKMESVGRKGGRGRERRGK
jgi:hypothetical protein